MGHKCTILHRQKSIRCTYCLFNPLTAVGTLGTKFSIYRVASENVRRLTTVFLVLRSSHFNGDNG